MADDAGNKDLALRDEIFNSFTSPLVLALDDEEIDARYLAKKLKEELVAEEPKVFKPRGEPISYSKPLPLWEIRQRARMDAQRLRGDYPVEEHRITGDMVVERSAEEVAILRNVAREVVERIRRGELK
jgi:hypothetical protein